MSLLQIKNHLSRQMDLTYNHSTKMIEFKIRDNGGIMYDFWDSGGSVGDGDCGFSNYRNVQVRFYFIYFKGWEFSYIDQNNFIVDPNKQGVIITSEYVSDEQNYQQVNPIIVGNDRIGLVQISLNEWYDKMGYSVSPIHALCIPVVENKSEPNKQQYYKIKIRGEYTDGSYSLNNFCQVGYSGSLEGTYLTSEIHSTAPPHSRYFILPTPIETPLLDYSFDCDINNNFNNKVTITNYDDNQYLEYTLLKLNEVTGIYEYYQDISSNEFYIPIEESGSKFKVRADNDGAFADGFSDVIEFGININFTLSKWKFPTLEYNLFLVDNCINFDSINYYMDGVFVGNSLDGNFTGNLPNPNQDFTFTGEVILNGEVIFNTNPLTFNWYSKFRVVEVITESTIINISKFAKIDYLLIGGGGAGGLSTTNYDHNNFNFDDPRANNFVFAGGGGAGGGIISGSLELDPSIETPLNISVGKGGINAGGENTSINDIVAFGGGKGGDTNAFILRSSNGSCYYYSFVPNFTTTESDGYANSGEDIAGGGSYISVPNAVYVSSRISNECTGNETYFPYILRGDITQGSTQQTSSIDNGNGGSSLITSIDFNGDTYIGGRGGKGGGDYQNIIIDKSYGDGGDGALFGVNSGIKPNTKGEDGLVVIEYFYDETIDTKYKPEFTASINYSLYPTLAYDASITNTEVEFNSVNWYLDGIYVGNSIGANFSGILANTNTDYVLTAEFVLDNFTLMSDQSITLRYVEGLNEGNFNLSINSVGCSSVSFNIANTIPTVSYDTLKIQVSIDNEWVDVGSPSKTATSVSVNYNPLLEYNSMYMFRLIAYSSDGFRYSNYVEVETIEITYYITTISGLQPSTSQGIWQYEITSFGSSCFSTTNNRFKLRFRLQGATTWNEKSVDSLSTYNGLRRAIYRLTGSNILRRGETYEVQARYYDLTFGGEVLSEIERFTTSDIEFPFNVQHNEPRFFNQNINWTNINYDRYYNSKVYIQVDGIGDLLVNPNHNYLNTTNFNITGLKPNTEYTWRFKIVHSNQYHDTDKTYYSNDYTFTTKKLPKHICEYDVKIINADCNNSNGVIYINGESDYSRYDYAQLFDYNLQYFDYDTNTLINNTTGNFYFNALKSGYYKLTITPKPIVWYYYGREGCIKEWIKLDNNDSTVGVNSITTKPAICSGFDNQPGRLQVQLDGVSPYYKYWFFNTDGLLINNGTTTNPYIVLNNATECYYGVIEDSNGCRYLMDEVCIPTETSSSISGIKQLFIAPVTGDIDFDYYNTEDDDYYLDGEDNSFFMSTKISRINTALSWYKIPIHNGQVDFKQSLNKNRQGFIFNDVMEVGIAHQTQEKLNTLLRNLLNKFIVVFQDSNGNWWISGYTSHASLDTVVLTTGRRYDSNQYTLNITSNSADNIITNIDEDWVKNNILN